MRHIQSHITFGVVRVRILWWILWAWIGYRYSIPLLMKNDLFIASVISTVITTMLCAIIVVFSLPPNLKKISSTAISIAFLYFFIVVVATIFSPYFSIAGFFRASGLLISSLMIVADIWLIAKRLSYIDVLRNMLRGFTFGISLTTITLLISNQGLGQNLRLGDLDVLHPNTLGFAYGVCALGLIFIRLYRSSFVQYSYLALMVAALLLTISKTSIAVVVFSFFMGLTLTRGLRKVRLFLLLALISLVLLFVLGDGLYLQLRTYIQNPDMVFTLTGRTLLWSYVLQKVSIHPVLGFGFGFTREVLGEVAGWDVSVAHAHNAFLDSLFSAGYLGLLAFLTLIGYVFVVVFRVKGNLRGKPPSAFLMAAFVFILGRSITEASLNLGADFHFLCVIALLSEKLSIVKLE